MMESEDHTYTKTESKLIDLVHSSTTQGTGISSTIEDPRVINVARTPGSSSTTIGNHDHVQAVPGPSSSSSPPGPSSSSSPPVPYTVGTIVLCAKPERIPTVAKILDFKQIGTPGHKTYMYTLKDEVSENIHHARHEFLSPYDPEFLTMDERAIGQIHDESLPKYAKAEKSRRRPGGPVPVQKAKKIHVPESEKCKHDPETLLGYLGLYKENCKKTKQT